MKTCSSCTTSKPVEAFARNKARWDGLAGQCKPCKAVSQTRWYRKNSATHKENVARRNRRVYEETYKKVFQYLLEHPCVDCGEADPVVLEFDHVRGIKLDAISRLITDHHSWPAVEQEILKCEVRCANCHRRETARRANWITYRLANKHR